MKPQLKLFAPEEYISTHEIESQLTEFIEFCEVFGVEVTEEMKGEFVHNILNKKNNGN